MEVYKRSVKRVKSDKRVTREDQSVDRRRASREDELREKTSFERRREMRTIKKSSEDEKMCTVKALLCKGMMHTGKSKMHDDKKCSKPKHAIVKAEASTAKIGNVRTLV